MLLSLLVRFPPKTENSLMLTKIRMTCLQTCYNISVPLREAL
jgi:hypothetical protein